MSAKIPQNKFTARYQLGLFVLSNWLYSNVVTGENGIANFDAVPQDVFTDKLFFLGAFKQFEEKLSADISDEEVLESMMDSKSFLLDKTFLKQVSNLNEEKMVEMIQAGESVYTLLLGKKLSENVIFDDEVVPTSYTCIDGSNETVASKTVPMHLVFSVDSDVLTKMESLLDLSNTTIVDEVISDLLKDDKFTSFTNTFDLLRRLESL